MYYAGSPNNADSDYFVDKSEIEGYFSNYNYITAFNVWHKFHLNMGFPFTGGWAEQPWWIVEFISLLENTYNEEQEAKYNKPDKSNKTLNSNNNNTNTDKTKTLNSG